MLLVGSGKADITPPVGLPLSGFAVRQNKPSIAIDDPLTVKGIIFQSGEQMGLLLSYDLLGFDVKLDQDIREKISANFGEKYFINPLLITTTHTHSTPPTMPIAGETRVPDAYINKILDATVSAVSEALDNMAEVELFHTSTDLHGINRNRRQSQFPQEPPDRFPYDPSFDLWVFKTKQGASHAAFVRFSCHAVTRCDLKISADYPGELTRRLEAELGAVCLFLQGTAGDTNPTVSSQDQAGVLSFVDQIYAQIDHLPAKLDRYPVTQFFLKERKFNLPFAPFPERNFILEQITRNKRILDGDTTSTDLQPLVDGYASWRLPDNLDLQGTLQHWAAVGIEAAEITLKAIDYPAEYRGLPFTINVLGLGPFILLFLSGEVLTTFGQLITGQYPNKEIKIISYLSPIVGYIGTQDDYRIGGYEPDSSSMWYRLPGPFRADIGLEIKKQVKSLLADNPHTDFEAKEVA
jgi:neutral ceramidase